MNTTLRIFSPLYLAIRKPLSTGSTFSQLYNFCILIQKPNCAALHVVLQVSCLGQAFSGLWKRQQIQKNNKQSDYESADKMLFTVETKGYLCQPQYIEEEILWKETIQAEKERGGNLHGNRRARKSRN